MQRAAHRRRMAVTRATLCIAVSALLTGTGAAQAQDKAASALKFNIQRFEVAGNTLLPADELAQAVAPFAGAAREMPDVQRAVEALTAAYRERGYTLVRVTVPEQDITGGVVRLRVQQGRIGKVTVEKNQHFSSANVRASLPSIKEGEAPNALDVARNLHLLNEHAVKQTKVQWQHGKTAGDVDITVSVEDAKPWRAIVALDNTGTSDTGHLRAGVALQHSNLFNRDHTASLQYITSPSKLDQVSIYGVGYRIPFYAWNSSLDLFAGYSDVSSGTVQGLFDVAGSGSIFGARWNYHLPKWQRIEQKIAAGIDYRAFKNDVVALGQSLVPDITIHPASLNYIGTVREANALLSFNVGVSANIPGGDNGRQADFSGPKPGFPTGSRANATAHYTILRYGFNASKAFEGDWQARIAYTGQYTRDALVSGEQFGLGGPASVRGYLVREVANDKGYSAQLEGLTPDIAKTVGLPDAFRLRAAAFYDFGGIKRNQALPGEETGKFIASTGFGIRMNYGKSMSLRVDIAQILKAAGTRQTNEQRVDASVAFIF